MSIRQRQRQLAWLKKAGILVIVAVLVMNFYNFVLEIRELNENMSILVDDLGHLEILTEE